MHRFRGYETTVPPKFEPVSLFEFKKSLRLCTTDTDEDSYLSSLLFAARDAVERYQKRSIVQRTVKMTLDGLCDVILPVLPNLVSVSSITYLDTAGDEQTLSTDYYNVDTTSMVGRITKAYAVAYPSTYSVESAVTVNYVSGYKKYTGTFNSETDGSLSVDFSDTIPQTGVVYIVNATGQYEVFGYRNAFNNGGVWNLTIPTSLTYTFAEDNVVEVHAIPEVTRQAIIAIAGDLYEHPSMSSEVSLSKNKTARMLLESERVHEFY